jgi:hypothetical protein
MCAREELLKLRAKLLSHEPPRSIHEALRRPKSNHSTSLLFEIVDKGLLPDPLYTLDRTPFRPDR